MSPSVRARVLLVVAAALGVVLAWGFTGIPDFGDYRGPYGEVLNDVAVRQRHAANVVTAVVFDYRGFDTLGEEFILFAAVIGVALLLRVQREEEEEVPRDESPERSAPHDSDATRIGSLVPVGPAVLFGLYVVLHGHLSPGGGFQGGVILATAPLFMYLGGEYAAFKRLSPESLIEAAEGAGVGAYVVIGVAGIVAGGPFLFNFLPMGGVGELVSSGTIALLSLSVGLAVSGGFVLLLSEFLEQTLMVRLTTRRH